MKQPLPQKQKIIWPDNRQFFLTSSTFVHFPYFKEAEQKQIVLDKIKQIKQVLGVPTLAFSIAINHLHWKFYLKEGKLMSKVKNMLHSGIAREYRKIYNVKYKEFWQSTRIFYIKNEKMSWKVTGYIIGNLLKHKEVSTFEELKANPFSSYKYTAKKFGEDMARELVYKVIDVPEDAEGIIDAEVLNNIKVEPPSWAA